MDGGRGGGGWFCPCRGTFTMRSNKPCKFFLRRRGFIPGGEREDANVYDALVKNSSNEKRLLFLRVGVGERLQSVQQLVHNPSAGGGGSSFRGTFKSVQELVHTLLQSEEEEVIIFF